MKKRQKYEMILFCKKDLKIPSVAERILLTEKLFDELKKSGENPEIAEYHHCCGYELYGKDYWKHTCWIDFYSAEELNYTQNEIWNSVLTYFKRFSEQSRKYPVVYKHYDRKFQTTYIYIIDRPFSNMDYIITIPDKKIIPAIPYRRFIRRCQRNSVPLSEILNQ